MRTVFFTVSLLLLSQAYVFSQQSTLIPTANEAAATFKSEMENMLAWCEAKRCPEEAVLARSALLPEEPGKVSIPFIPHKTGTLDLPRGLPRALPREYAAYATSTDAAPPDVPGADVAGGKKLTDAQIARIRIVELRQKHAKKLNELAKKAARNDRGTLAVQLGLAALHADPDHAALRNAFGYVKYKDEWRTPWEADKLRNGFVDHERFGWIPQKHVKKYEAGERYYDGRWISAGEDARQHASIKNGWVIESEYYLLATNHSIEEGVRLRRRLEHLYRAWKMLFFRYTANDVELASMFDGKNKPQIRPYKYKVLIHRNQADFLAENRDVIGRFASANVAGFYSSGRKISTFYTVDPATASEWERENCVLTMYHEATHQLFHETNTRAESHGRNGNYWVIEGVAQFMESLQIEGAAYTVGGWNNQRLRAARHQQAQEGFAMPVGELIALDYGAWTGTKDAGKLYAQAAATFQYLYFAEGGRFRDPLIVYLRLVYEGKDTAATFGKLTGVTLSDFDEAYQKALRSRTWPENGDSGNTARNAADQP